MMDVFDAGECTKLQQLGPAAFVSAAALCLCAWTTAASSEPASGVSQDRV